MGAIWTEQTVKAYSSYTKKRLLILSENADISGYLVPLLNSECKLKGVAVSVKCYSHALVHETNFLFAHSVCTFEDP